MSDFELIKTEYQKLRTGLIKWLDKFNDDSYFYQPTEMSNSAAWIVPHISAFERVMVVDKIEGYEFTEFITDRDIAIYRPGVKAYAFEEDELMSMDDAIALLRKTEEVSIQFIDSMIAKDDSVKHVDESVGFRKFLFNILHETEHYGQLKYLSGTWTRLHE
ncbi:MAG: DinB family protein [Candidatus Thorarchaeota archaeon]